MREVFDEMLATEATYLRDLRLVEVHYLTPLRKLLSPPVRDSHLAHDRHTTGTRQAHVWQTTGTR